MKTEYKHDLDYQYYKRLRFVADELHNIAEKTDVQLDDLILVIRSIIAIRYKGNPCKTGKR